ncbi:MAG: hypothetical protein WAU99_11385, partial [Pseudolabrys sp.]
FIAGYFAWGCFSIFGPRHHIAPSAHSISTEDDRTGQHDAGALRGSRLKIEGAGEGGRFGPAFWQNEPKC